MSKITLKGKVGRAAAVAAVVGAGITPFLASPAGADPKSIDAFVGVGSDTTQDVMNALSGFANGKNYTPVQSTDASKRQVSSFDAVPPSGSTVCITTKLASGAFFRPNGSSNGRRALSRAVDQTGWGLGGAAAGCGLKNVAGSIDFARSSSGPSSGDTATDLTYLPFGRDGVSFAYYKSNGGAVTTLTRAQLTSLFTTGPQTIGGVEIVPCGIQTGSGTFGFWNTVTTATEAQENTATATCNAVLGRAQENDAAALKARGDSAALAGKQVIIGFSAANFISQSNGVAGSQLAPGVDLGSVSNNGSGTNLGKPYGGTAPNLAPNATFYGDTTFGRDVYNVVPTAIIDSGFGNTAIKGLFKGNTSAICSSAAQDVVNKFGFSSIANCGSNALKGGYLAGQG